MSNLALPNRDLESLPLTIGYERSDFSKVTVRAVLSDLVIPQSYLRRMGDPQRETPFPLEYAFYLLGDFAGKTVIDLACGEGLNAVTLASLGAKVIAVDRSDENLRRTRERALANDVQDNIALFQSDPGNIPFVQGIVDSVLCVTKSLHNEFLTVARQIRKILKPGGTAVFIAPLASVAWLRPLRSLPGLTLQQAESISRAVGRCGRRREFSLTSRVLERARVRWKKSRPVDTRILARFVFAPAFASTVVWEGLKEA